MIGINEKFITITGNTMAVVTEDYVEIIQKVVATTQVEVVTLTHEDMKALVAQYKDIKQEVL